MSASQTPAQPNDVTSMDAIIAAMYDVISGPAGQKRDWDRFRSLFLPGARFVLAITREGEMSRARVLDVEEYIRRVEPFFAGEDFWEREVARTTETFKLIAHAFSTYESSREKNGTPFEGGVNSIQLLTNGSRWWIASVMWNTARG